MRVASVQHAARGYPTPEAALAAIADQIRIAADYAPDLVVLPEYVGLTVLSAYPDRASAKDTLRRAAEHWDAFVRTVGEAAQIHGLTVVGGTHPRIVGEEIRNTCPLALPSGEVILQDKLHPTPDEASVWGVSPGTDLALIDAPFGRFGVMICYDSEFPEVAQTLTDRGARLLCVPQNTDTRHGHLRVRTCSAARAVETQCFVVTSGMVGTYENVENLDVQFCQSAILTPCDLPFARDGVAAEATPGVEEIIFADLDLAKLDWAREHGAVRNQRDRRPDLYAKWTSEGR